MLNLPPKYLFLLHTFWLVPLDKSRLKFMLQMPLLDHERLDSVEEYRFAHLLLSIIGSVQCAFIH